MGTSKLKKLFSEAMAATNVKPKITQCQMIILAFRNSPYGENEEDLYGLATCTDIHDYVKKTFPYYRNSDLVFKKHLGRLLSFHKVFEKTHLALDHQRVYWKINRSYYVQESTNPIADKDKNLQGIHPKLVKRIPAPVNRMPIPLLDPEMKKNLFQTQKTFKLTKLFSEATAETHVRPKISLCQMIVLAFRNSPYGEYKEDSYGLATSTDIYEYIKKTFPYYRNSDCDLKQHLSRLLCFHKVFEKTDLALGHRRVYWKIGRAYYTQQCSKKITKVDKDPQERHPKLVKRIPDATENCMPIPLKHPETKKNLFDSQNTSKYAKLYSEATTDSNVRPKITISQMTVLAFRNSPYGENKEDLYGLATCADIHDYIKNTFPYYRNTDSNFKNQLSVNLSHHKEVFVKTDLVVGNQSVYWKISRSYYAKLFPILQWSKWSNSQIESVLGKEGVTSDQFKISFAMDSKETKIKEEVVDGTNPSQINPASDVNCANHGSAGDIVIKSEIELEFKEETKGKSVVMNADADIEFQDEISENSDMILKSETDYDIKEETKDISSTLNDPLLILGM